MSLQGLLCIESANKGTLLSIPKWARFLFSFIAIAKTSGNMLSKNGETNYSALFLVFMKMLLRVFLFSIMLAVCLCGHSYTGVFLLVLASLRLLSGDVGLCQGLFFAF